MRLLVFCEAEGDFRAIAGLVDRVLREQGPAWFREHLEHYPLDDLRTWVGPGDRPFFDVHHVYKDAQRRSISLPHNRFDGRKGAAGYLAARTAFLVARHETRTSGALDAVIHVIDADNQGDARRDGQRDARTATLPSHDFAIVLGCPDLEREAWVLAGFEPENAVERERLAAERHALGFCPCDEAHRLRDHQDSAPRSPKRALRDLTRGDPEREERCWTEAPLDRLRARGVASGLRAFLDELGEHLVPLCERSARPG